jgi:hypothetical protein
MFTKKRLPFFSTIFFTNVGEVAFRVLEERERVMRKSS